MDATDAISAASFIKEKDAIQDKITKICRLSEAEEGEADEAFKHGLDGDFEQLKSYLDKYQEQSHLLDVHLEALIDPVMRAVKVIIHDNDFDSPPNSPDPRPTIQSPSSSSPAASAAGGVTMTPFSLQKICGGRIGYRLQIMFKVVYLLCKIRGYKTVVKMLPHEAMDLEPALRLLQRQDTRDFRTWETRYALLIWLSILALIPFDLTSVDSSANRSLIDGFIATTQSFLNDPGPSREAAAFCLAKLLTRPDLDSVYLGRFLEWSLSRLQVEGGPDTFEMSGILHCLANVYKIGHRQQLLHHYERGREVFQHLCNASSQQKLSSQERKLMVKLMQRFGLSFLPPRVVSWRYSRGRRTLLRPDTTQPPTQSSLQPSAAKQSASEAAEEEEDSLGEEESWAFGEIEDVIEFLLIGLRDRETVVRWSAAKGIGRVTARLSKDLADDVVAFVIQLLDACEPDSAWHGGCLALAELARRGLLLPSRLPTVVPLLLQALLYDVRKGQTSVGAHVRDAACYVSWAFARAYAPSVMKPFVPDLAKTMLVTAVFDREINCRRAAAAAFQENVGRQGHENFKHGIEILTRADYFNLGNRTRAYLEVAPFIAGFPEYQRALIDHLARHKIFHWDLDIRRLSAKTLGVLATVAPSYVCGSVLQELIPQTLSAQMFVRHGATLALAEIIASSAANGEVSLDEETMKKLRNVVMKVEKARLYRGRGGEWMRAACCDLIRSICDAAHPLAERTQLRLLESIHESMKHPKEEVKRAAIEALKSLSHVYFTVANEGGHELSMLLKSTIEVYAKGVQEDPNPAARRAFALALGALPARLVAADETTLELVICSLEEAAVLRPCMDAADEEMKDAETRRNAVGTVGSLMKKIPLASSMPQPQPGNSPMVGATEQQFSRLFTVLLRATTDYDIDNRGDVGSWVRMEALGALCSVIGSMRQYPHDVVDRVQVDGEWKTILRRSKSFCWVRDDNTQATSHLSLQDLRQYLHTAEMDQTALQLLTPDRMHAVVCALIKQLGEKMVVVRERAGLLLSELLLRLGDPHYGVCLTVTDLSRLRSAMNLCNRSDESDINWRVESETYPCVACILDLATYRRSALDGLVVSIGDLTESVSKSAAGAVVAWSKEADCVEAVVNDLFALLEEQQHCDRVTVPALKTLNLLVQHGILQSDKLQTAVEGVRAELKGTRNVNKLLQATVFFSAVVAEAGDCKHLRDNALKSTLILLGHRYPKVRNDMYNRLYMALLAVGADALLTCDTSGKDRDTHNDTSSSVEPTMNPATEGTGNETRFDQLVDVLTSTSWSKVSTSEARDNRDKLYPLLALPLPERTERRRVKRERLHDTREEEDANVDNYASLIKSIEMGY